MIVPIDGFEIHYTDSGSGFPLLFLHGWGAPAAAYKSVTAPLESRYRVIFPEFPGVGESPDPAAPLTVEDYASIARGLLRHLELDACDIFCHSHGGRVAAQLMTDENAPRVPKAVFMDAAGIPPRRSAAWKARQSGYKLLKKLGTSRVTAPLFGELYEAERDKRSSADYRAASPVMRQTLSAVVNTDMRERLQRIRSSVLLLWGENDTATPLSDGQEMETLIPGSGLAVIRGAGHFPFVDNPAQFRAVVDAFLTGGEQ